jgi:hypothetical protein
MNFWHLLSFKTVNLYGEASKNYKLTTIQIYDSF